jgi:hypothetical protein
MLNTNNPSGVLRPLRKRRERAPWAQYPTVAPAEDLGGPRKKSPPFLSLADLRATGANGFFASSLNRSGGHLQPQHHHQLSATEQEMMSRLVAIEARRAEVRQRVDEELRRKQQAEAEAEAAREAERRRAELHAKVAKVGPRKLARIQSMGRRMCHQGTLSNMKAFNEFEKVDRELQARAKQQVDEGLEILDRKELQIREELKSARARRQQLVAGPPRGEAEPEQPPEQQPAQAPAPEPAQEPALLREQQQPGGQQREQPEAAEPETQQPGQPFATQTAEETDLAEQRQGAARKGKGKGKRWTVTDATLDDVHDQDDGRHERRESMELDEAKFRLQQEMGGLEQEGAATPGGERAGAHGSRPTASAGGANAQQTVQRKSSLALTVDVRRESPVISQLTNSPFLAPDSPLRHDKSSVLQEGEEDDTGDLLQAQPAPERMPPGGPTPLKQRQLTAEEAEQRQGAARKGKGKGKRWTVTDATLDDVHDQDDGRHERRESMELDEAKFRLQQEMGGLEQEGAAAQTEQSRPEPSTVTAPLQPNEAVRAEREAAPRQPEPTQSKRQPPAPEKKEAKEDAPALATQPQQCLPCVGAAAAPAPAPGAAAPGAAAPAAGEAAKGDSTAKSGTADCGTAESSAAESSVPPRRKGESVFLRLHELQLFAASADLGHEFSSGSDDTDSGSDSGDESDAAAPAPRTRGRKGSVQQLALRKQRKGSSSSSSSSTASVSGRKGSVQQLALRQQRKGSLTLPGQNAALGGDSDSEEEGEGYELSEKEQDEALAAISAAMQEAAAASVRAEAAAAKRAGTWVEADSDDDEEELEAAARECHYERMLRAFNAACVQFGAARLQGEHARAAGAGELVRALHAAIGPQFVGPRIVARVATLVPDARKRRALLMVAAAAAAAGAEGPPAVEAEAEGAEAEAEAVAAEAAVAPAPAAQPAGAAPSEAVPPARAPGEGAGPGAAAAPPGRAVSPRKGSSRKGSLSTLDLLNALLSSTGQTPSTLPFAAARGKAQQEGEFAQSRSLKNLDLNKVVEASLFSDDIHQSEDDSGSGGDDEAAAAQEPAGAADHAAEREGSSLSGQAAFSSAVRAQLAAAVWLQRIGRGRRDRRHALDKMASALARTRDLDCPCTVCCVDTRSVLSQSAAVCTLALALSRRPEHAHHTTPHHTTGLSAPV